MHGVVQVALFNSGRVCGIAQEALCGSRRVQESVVHRDWGGCEEMHEGAGEVWQETEGVSVTSTVQAQGGASFDFPGKSAGKVANDDLVIA